MFSNNWGGSLDAEAQYECGVQKKIIIETYHKIS